MREEMTGAYPLDPPLEIDVGVGDDLAGRQVAPARRVPVAAPLPAI